MAIRPPSDIVLDVARAAEPQRLQSAYRALTEGADVLQAGAPPGSGDARVVSAAFDGALRHLGQSPPVFGAPRVVSEKEMVYRKLEQAVLERMVDYMLPRDGAHFGSGTAGHMWRGMMAEQLARAITEGGGVGIARQLAVRSPLDSPARASVS